MSLDDHDEFPDDEEEEPRSLLSSLWFRLALVVAAVGVVGVIAVPRALDYLNPSNKIGPSKPVAAVAPMPSIPAPAPKTEPAPAPTAPATVTAPAPEPAATTPPSTAPAPPVTAAPAPAPALPPSPPPAPAAKSEGAGGSSQAASAIPDKPGAKGAAKSSVKATTGDFWVQVASFKQSDQASRLATKLRDQNFTVVETTATIRGADAPRPAPTEAAPAAPPAGESRYDVFVSGTSPDDVTPALPSNEVTAEALGDGSIIKPSLPLSEAVALSKTLAAAGLKVQVRRVRAGEPAVPAGASESAAGESSVYRVRVGPFPDHPTAVAAMHELEARGYKPFIARARP